MNEQLPVSAAVIARARHYRTQRGLSAQAYADALTAAGYPIRRSVIANQESGRVQSVSVDQLIAAATVLGVPVGYLLADEPCDRCTGSPPLGFICGACGTVGGAA